MIAFWIKGVADRFLRGLEQGAWQQATAITVDPDTSTVRRAEPPSATRPPHSINCVSLGDTRGDVDQTDDQATSSADSPTHGETANVQPDRAVHLTRDMILNLDDRRQVVLDEVPGLGRVAMRDISVKVSREVRALAEASSTPARTFATELARNVITDPDLKEANLDELIPEAAWDQLAPALAETSAIHQWYLALPDDMDPRERLYHAEQNRWEQWAKELRISLQPGLAEITGLLKTNLPGILPAARQILDVRGQLGTITASLGTAYLHGMAGMIADISRSFASVSALAVDSALLSSGINSALIHTPSYVPPRLAVPSASLTSPPTPELAERQRMLNAYDVLVRFEQAMRRFISERLNGAVGPGWWKQRVPEPVRANCQLSQARATKGEDKPLIEYAQVGEYRDIILKADNWREVFAPIFGSKAQVEACFEWCTAARVEIGHSRPLPNDLWTAFNFATRWFIAAVERPDSPS